MPRPFDHVLIIMFENQYRSYVLENPYFHRLARQGIDLANAHGVMHPSQTNYIASIAGELCNVTDDDKPPPLAQRTIVDLVEQAGLTWKAYMQSYVPGHDGDQFPYVEKHDPFSSFPAVDKAKIVDESQFWVDVLNGELPNYAWFTPNMWNDGHYTVGTKAEPAARAPALVDQAAAWLERFFLALRFPGEASHLPPRTLVVVTFDESDFEASTEVGNKYTYDGPNQIYTVLLGDGITPGVEHEGYNHYSVMRTIEANFGLDDLGKNDAHANRMRFLWGEHFAWSGPADTPLEAPRAAAEIAGLLHVFEPGRLSTFDGEGWSTARPTELTAPRAAIRLKDELLIVDADRCLRYHPSRGFCSGRTVLPSDATDVALSPVGDEAMLVWRNPQGDLHSRRYADGTWAAPIPVGHTCDGPVALGALGLSVFLIVTRGDQLEAISYNAAPYNVTTVPDGKYAGPYDDTTLHAWSPSAFPVARFAAGPEPITVPYTAGRPPVLAPLDGVLHLVHPGAKTAALLTETFSIAGLLTAKLPVSYKQSDAKTTSNGYGTLAEASWTAQAQIPNAWLPDAATPVMAPYRGQLVLLYGGKAHIGRYTAR